MGHFQPVEPEDAHRGQNAALLRDAGRHHPVEGADSVGSDDRESVAEVVDVAYFSAPAREARDLALQQRFG